ncbi:hypothetical protein PsorP6_009125 [Peronosclerospora sorghi]|uniref:Uncharacterized protein n=1 Tax=Peronosclerospora sorghi TaxID=230839 RepID=A0ACC0VYS2_9STRA|nr:hypothetical protein PsorP6_009125 [Peronosclerospora sorghi]
MPPSILGHLLTKMVKSKQYHQVLEVARTYFAHDDFLAARDFQQQGFFALGTHVSRRGTRHETLYVYDSHGDAKTMQSLVLERGFGAAIQCCVTLEEYPLALECFSVMAHVRATFVGRTDSSNSLDDTWNEATPIVDDFLPMDENICVNVMKACMALTKFSTLKDVYRGMVARRVARSAGFELAIRYCHKHLDARFLEEVLDGVFATELALSGQWMLKVAN